MTDKSACLSTPTGNFDFPVLEGTVGPEVVDIRKLYGQSGMFTYDPDFAFNRELRKRDHLYRRRKGYPSSPRLSDRTACRAVELHGTRLSASSWRVTQGPRAR